MTTILQNVDLFPHFWGWETSAANAFDTVLFTGNWFTAYSVDAGTTFQEISADDVLRELGHALKCDQVALYIPSINCYVWCLLTKENTVVMAITSPQRLRESKGKQWALYHFTAGMLGSNDKLDHPNISVGANFLYMTVNITSGGEVIDGRMIRMPLQEIGHRATIHFEYLLTASQRGFICPAQNTGAQGLFALLVDTATIRVFSWDEPPGNGIRFFELTVPTIPDQDWESLTPDLQDWLPLSSKREVVMRGAARTGQELWLAWTGARRVGDASEDTFPHPHIGIAVVALPSRKLLTQRYLWNPDFAFSWPSLAANDFGDVAISFAWGGGGRHYAQHGVGILNDDSNPISTTVGESIGSGGHYVKVGTCFPASRQFVAAGFNQVKDPSTPAGHFSHPHFIVFKA